MPPFTDITGARFGRLWVRQRVALGGRSGWACDCDCGARTVVMFSSLKSGDTASCGCLHRERAAEAQRTHGSAPRRARTREYKTWTNIRSRCTSPSNSHYPNYGGRGIRVCDAWRDFSVFLRDVGPRPSLRHSLDRIDNDGHYEPGNVRWATHRQQSSNKRTNRLLTHNGETHTVSGWARRLGIARGTLKQRLRYGWTVERALTQALRAR